ncbi:MAG: hypothetical protein V4623_10420, partial [Pseudomonadota bacterium]
MTGLIQATHSSAGPNRDLATSAGAIDVLAAPQLNPLEPNHADFALMTPTELERNEQETLNFLDLLDSVGTGQEGRDVPELITSIRTNMGFLEGGQADSELLGKLDLLLLVAALDHFQKRIPDHLLIYAQALGKVGAMLQRVKDECISRLSTHIELAKKWVEGVSISEISRDLSISVKRGLEENTKSTALYELEKLPDLPSLAQLAEDFELEKECRLGGILRWTITVNKDEVALLHQIGAQPDLFHPGYIELHKGIYMLSDGSKKFEQIVALLDKALKSGLSEIGQGMAHGALATAYNGLSRFDQTEQHLKAYKKIHPNDPNIYAVMASIYWDQGHSHGANSENPGFCAQNHVVAAMEHAEQALVRNPYHIQAREVLAYAHAACGDLRLAVEHMKIAKQSDTEEKELKSNHSKDPGGAILEEVEFSGQFGKPDNEKIKSLNYLKPLGERSLERVIITQDLILYLKSILKPQDTNLLSLDLTTTEHTEIHNFALQSANSFMRPFIEGVVALREGKTLVSRKKFEEAFKAPAEHKAVHERLLLAFYKSFFFAIAADYAKGLDRKEGKAKPYLDAVHVLVEMSKHDRTLAAACYLHLATGHLITIRAELRAQHVDPNNGETVLPYYRSTRQHELIEFVIEPLKQAISLDPNLVSAHEKLAGTYAAIGEMENAKNHYDIATELVRLPTYYEKHIAPHLGNILGTAAAGVAAVTAAYGLVHNAKTRKAQETELNNKIEGALAARGTPLSKALRQLYLERILAAQ